MSVLVLFLLLTVLTYPHGGEAADVHFAWDAPSVPAHSYVMERKTGLAGTYAPVGYPATTQWTDTDIPATNERALCWQVRAVNAFGLSPPSNELCLSLPDIVENFRMIVETFGPSADAPGVSVRTRVRERLTDQ